MGAQFSLAKPTPVAAPDVALPAQPAEPTSLQHEIAKAAQQPVSVVAPTAVQSTQAHVQNAAQATVNANGATEVFPVPASQIQVKPAAQSNDRPIYIASEDNPKGEYRITISKGLDNRDRPGLNIAFPNFKGQMVLDVEGGSKDEGAKVILWPRNNGKNQELLVMTDNSQEANRRSPDSIIGLGGNFVFFQFAHSGLYLAADQNGGLIQSSKPLKFRPIQFGFGVVLAAVAGSDGFIVPSAKGEQVMIVPEKQTRAPGFLNNAGIMTLQAAGGNYYLSQVPQMCVDNWGSIALATTGLVAVGALGYYAGKRNALKNVLPM